MFDLYAYSFRFIDLCDLFVRQAILLACLFAWKTETKPLNFVRVSHINRQASKLPALEKHHIWKILIILINDSNDSNHLSKFTILVVAAFTKKEERKIQRQ